jgi:hypothetical protein
MKPKHAKKKTRPYRSIGLKMGMVRAFLLAGLISGEAKRTLREAIAHEAILIRFEKMAMAV